MADNFFNTEENKMEPQEEVKQEEQGLPEAIKVGDKAYNQEQIQHLAQLDDQVRDLESKWNTKIDRLMPEFTKSRQQLSDYEKEAQTRRDQELQTKQQQGQVRLS